MGRFWASWYQPGDDPRPLTAPPGEGVLGWWVSGETEDSSTVCALVTAATGDDAKTVIAADWPEAGEAAWRFVRPVAEDWVPPADRFPPSEWMRKRLLSEKKR